MNGLWACGRKEKGQSDAKGVLELEEMSWPSSPASAFADKKTEVQRDEVICLVVQQAGGQNEASSFPRKVMAMSSGPAAIRGAGLWSPDSSRLFWWHLSRVPSASIIKHVSLPGRKAASGQAV